MKLTDVARYIKYHGACATGSLLKPEPAGLGLSKDQAFVAIGELLKRGKVRPLTTKWSFGIWWVWQSVDWGTRNPAIIRQKAYQAYSKYWSPDEVPPGTPTEQDSGLSIQPRQYKILRFVDEYSTLYGGITTDQLCGFLGKDRKHVIGVMSRLKRRGYVTKELAPKTGKRGRPPILWVLENPDYVDDVAAWSENGRQSVQRKLEVDRQVWVADKMRMVRESRDSTKP